MSSSLAPECNEVKECVYTFFNFTTGLANTASGATTHVFSSGTVTVRNHRLLLYLSNCTIEYLRGEPTMDECQLLFKNYKICLDVSRPVVALWPRRLISARKP